MRPTPPEDEQALHERLLQRTNPTDTVDVYLMYMDRISKGLKRKLKCQEDTAYDATIDVLLTYANEPGRYDPRKGEIFRYLMRAAEHRVLDKLRSASARMRREKEFMDVVELQQRTPKEEMEVSVEAKLVLERLETRHYLTNERDRAALRLILSGERSTERIAEALVLPSMSTVELRREVKRHRDRLMKLLERVKKEDPDDES